MSGDGNMNLREEIDKQLASYPSKFINSEPTRQDIINDIFSNIEKRIDEPLKQEIQECDDFDKILPDGAKGNIALEREYHRGIKKGLEYVKEMLK